MAKSTSAVRVATRPVETASVKDITGESMSFESMLNESFKGVKSFEGTVVADAVRAARTG